MRIRLLAVALTCILARVSTAQNPARLFVNENAYDPLPSPDGELVAFVLTGKDPGRGSGGFGRSNLRSLIGFADASGTTFRNTSAFGFLSGWAPDSKAVVSFRDWQFSLVDIDGKQRNSGLIPEAKHASRPDELNA